MPAQPPPPPPSQAVSFSLAAPRSVREGEELSFAIDRVGNDQRPHRISLRFDPAGLVINPPRFVAFDPGENEVSVTVRTAAGSAGDGDRELKVMIGSDQSVAPGKLAVAEVSVLDRQTPRPWWLIVAAVAAMAAAGYAIYKFLFPPRLYPTWTTEPEFSPP